MCVVDSRSHATGDAGILLREHIPVAIATSIFISAWSRSGGKLCEYRSAEMSATVHHHVPPPSQISNPSSFISHRSSVADKIADTTGPGEHCSPGPYVNV